MTTSTRVAFWMSCSAISFGLLVGTARYLSAELDVMVITFWRNCFSALFFVPWLLRVGPAGLRTQRLGLHGLRAAFFVVASITLFLSVTLMPLAEATALSFTSPLFATLLAMLVLKERVAGARWLALIVGFGGVVIVLRPGYAAMDPAALIVLLSAATFASVIVMGKMLANADGPGLITFYLSLLSIPLSFLPALTVWSWPGPEQFLWLAAIGAFGIMNIYGLARALRIGDASLAMPFDFLRLPATAAVGYVAFAQRPDLMTWVGAAVIFSSSIIIGRR